MITKNKTSEYDKKMQETLLGIDYGERNIGLAFGRNGLVSPLTVISDKDDETAIKEISRYTLENKVDKLIVGMPVNAAGKDTDQTRKVRKFVKYLKIKLKKPVDIVNEFRTSADSKTDAINLGISKKRRGTIDHLSAALILKEYYSRL